MAKTKKLSRKIYMIGGVDEVGYAKFSKRLTALEKQSSSAVEIELNSPGGSPYDALAFCARIRRSPCQIIIKAYGIVASAAVLILAAGDERVLTKEAWVMVHEDSAVMEGEVHVMERDIAHLRRMEHQWNELLEQFTGTKRSVWAQLHTQTTYLTAEQCLNLGLATKVE